MEATDAIEVGGGHWKVPVQVIAARWRLGMCQAGGRGEILCVYSTAAAARDMSCSGSEAAKRPRGTSGLGDIAVEVEVEVEARKMAMPMIATRARTEAMVTVTVTVTVMETTRTTTGTTAAAMALESACAVLRRAS